MSRSELKARYQSGGLDKPEYIDRMDALHASLFEYADFIRNTDIARIEITDRYVTLTSRSRGVQMSCDRTDKRIAPMEILNFDHYEKADSEMIFSLIREDFTVFDIGANVGWYSLNIGRTFARVRVYAFEPVPDTFASLQRNIALNGLANVQARNLGFLDQDSERTFHYDPECSVAASCCPRDPGGNARAIRCTVQTLDSFVRAMGLKVDFIKCDVEGAELLVLKGGQATLSTQHPILFAELHRKWCARFNYHPNEIIHLLAGLGYRCFTAKSSRLTEFSNMSEDTIETNFFFLHTKQHAADIASLAPKACA